VQVHYPLVHLHSYYRKRFGDRSGRFPAAESFASRTISLPMYPDMRDEDVTLVVEVVKRALQ
jgi:dTDP-4-amino-4,6-dideoxygalactose transaminase